MIYQSEALSVNYVTDDIAELIFDASGSVNTLNLSTLENLNEALDALHAQQNLKGLLLRSSKDSFIVGADITEFLNIFSQPSTQLSQWLSHANDIFNKLEDLPVPTISIINGYALGGGCECVLATDFRIAEPKAHIGLPETKLGIMPGFGGTVRLPRLIGADSAMEIITTGKDKKASEALKLGLIDAVVESESLISSAITMLHEAITGKLPWQQRRQQKQKPLTLNKIEATMSFTTAKALITKIAGSHYPAPITAVSTIEQSAQLTRNEALVIEHKNFITLAKTDVAKALISLFLNDQYIKGQTKKATKTVTAPKHCMVLGAGIMGGGIAYQSALKGMPVLMKDINQSSLTLGMNEAAKLLNKQLERGKIDGLQMAKTLSSITPTLYNSGAKEADIIVEAVIENPKIKAAVLSEIENQITDKTVITSNTSTIPINLLAQGLKRPENFCGMHFFNPVHRMPLIEIIRGSQTSEATINRVMAYAAKMGKSPIVVNDCPGFFVNRVLFPYFIGFSLLLNDGADYITVDQVMENEFGWPMGPAYLLDVVGIDTAHHAQLVMAESYPSRMSKTQKDAIDVMFEAKRFGQKNGNGFFNYTLDRKGKPKKVITNETRQLLATICQPLNDFNKETIIARMMIPMINEVVRCLEENIIATPAEADMALIYGLGFPPFRGGVFRYLDTLGLANYVTMAEQYTDLGGAYNIPSGLRLKAKNNETYYSTTNVNT